MSTSQFTVEYDPESGALSRGGAPVGTVNAGGYVVLRHQGKVVYAHRLIWLMMTGEEPKIVDHIDGNRANNKWSNLRSVDGVVNSQNRLMRRTRKHDLPPGAHFHGPSGGIKSAISVNGRQVHLGYFKTPGEASAAYEAAKLKNHDIEGVRYAEDIATEARLAA